MRTINWLTILSIIIGVDLLILLGVVYYFAILDPLSQANAPTPTYTTVQLRPTMTATPWQGPGKRVTATPTLPPTPLPTRLTYDPVEAPVQPASMKIEIDYEAFLAQLPILGGKGKGDIPIIDQTQFHEPFFPPGANNSCGPVALLAGLQGLGADELTYQQVRNIAVGYDYASYGISTWGLVNTAYTLNDQMGNPFEIEQSRYYTVRQLAREVNSGAVVIPLVRLSKVDGKYQFTTNQAGSIGHFLVLERMNPNTNQVWLAGSVLNMDNPSRINDFVASWSSNPPEPDSTFTPLVSLAPDWFTLKPLTGPPTEESDQPTGWAMIIRRN